MSKDHEASQHDSQRIKTMASQKTMVQECRTVDSVLCIVSRGQWIVDNGQWAVDSGQWAQAWPTLTELKQ